MAVKCYAADKKLGNSCFVCAGPQRTIISKKRRKYISENRAERRIDTTEKGRNSIIFSSKGKYTF